MIEWHDLDFDVNLRRRKLYVRIQVSMPTVPLCDQSDAHKNDGMYVVGGHSLRLPL